MHGIRFVSALGLVLLACNGDDGGDAGDDGTTGAPTSTGGMTTAAPTGSDTTPPDDSTSGGPGTASTGEPPGTTTEPADGSTGDTDTTGGGVDGVVLQNDSWTPADSIVWQTWPNTDDCWASTYTPSAEHYPFQIAGAVVAIGDAAGVFTFGVGVWEVDNQGMPDVEIDSTSVEIDGASGDLTQIDFDALGLALPVVESGEFAIVMCHTEHMGQPTIAIDADGDVAAAGNWVFQQAMGEWVQSPDFFDTDGDFIMRAVIQPQG